MLPALRAFYGRQIQMDVMVRLYGTEADVPKLAAADAIASAFDGYLRVLFIDVLPFLATSSEWSSDGQSALALLAAAHALADEAMKKVDGEVKRLRRPVEIRRIEAIAEDAAQVVAHEARTADAFVGNRPGDGGASEPRQLLETVLFESGRHVLIVPADVLPTTPFRRVVVAWNGSREATRAVAEAMPYLTKANAITILVATDGPVANDDALIGGDLRTHLEHAGIAASVRYVERDGPVGPQLLHEAVDLEADLLVMGGYGHWRVREWLLGGATRDLLYGAPMPVLAAH
jgi:nucleotide-binding universal stress UspA family protein